MLRPTSVGASAHDNGGRAAGSSDGSDAGAASSSRGADGVAKGQDLGLGVGGAGLDGAVVDAAAKVAVLAEAGDVGLAAAESLGLAEHAGDTVLLDFVSGKLVILIEGLLTPHCGREPMSPWAETRAAKRAAAVTA